MTEATATLTRTEVMRSITHDGRFRCHDLRITQYFAQPLLSPIAPVIGLPLQAAGTIVMLSQLGYCAGLLLLAPLGDRVDHRRLVLLTLGGLCIALLAASRAGSAAAFLAASFAIGLGCTAVQMIVPIAARMADEASRGRVVGVVTSGLLAGIMLSRPVASLFAAQAAWRRLYLADALLLALLGVLLARRLPSHRPVAPASYRQLLVSFGGLLRRHARLRRLGGAQACLFGAFSLFWGAAPFVLLHRFGLSPAGLAWVLAALMIDAGVQICHVVAQSAVLSIDAAARNRLNSLYIAIFFFGGALGSMLASWALTLRWPLVAALGMLCAAAAAPLAGEPGTRFGQPFGAGTARRRAGSGIS
ncbi:MAG: MFS transporter [Burkholderia sp.]